MIGPPIGVDPRNAMAHRAITRPRISGTLSSCKVEFPSERKLIEKMPTRTRAAMANTRLGAIAAARIAAPNRNAALTIMRGTTRVRLAVYSPPITDPMPIATVRAAYVPARSAG